MSKAARNESSRSRNSKEKQVEEYMKAIFDDQQVSMLDLVTKKDLVIFGFQQNQILEEKWLRTDDNIQVLDGKIEGLSSEMKELKTRMQHLETRMQHLEADMQGIKNNMASLETTVTKQVQELKDIWWKTVSLLTTIIVIVIAILRFFS